MVTNGEYEFQIGITFENFKRINQAMKEEKIKIKVLN